MQAVSIQVESVTPILIVSEIEPCLEFWQRLGFQKIAEVPHGNRLGFVMFTNGGQNLMLQTESSADADVKIAPRSGGGVVYLSVPSIEAVEQMIDRALVVLPRRDTFYAATEVWVREPGGNLVGFAQHKK
jgi:catechol 2,3-dioxygenase-like lactoylglutathione lyase family enzyme